MKTLKQISRSKRNKKNIDAHEEVEKALRQSEKRYKQLLNSITDYIYSVEIKDGSPTKTVHGKGSEKVTGYTPAEYAADPKLWLSMVHPNDISYVEHYADLLHGGKEVPPLEHRLIHKTGKICWIQNTYVLKHNTAGKVIGYDGLISDITERKNAELELIRANRIYAIISQIDQMVVRTKNRDKLFSEACRITIEYGKFRMVWIGLVDEREQVVKPIAFDGFEDGFLATTKKISLHNIPEGHGPTSRAIHKGRYCCCNDIANDSSMVIWRDEALKRGYRSSISLPIFVQGKTIGAFNIFASEPFFFNKSEIQLLKEVTGDIAYAVETIDTAERRKQVEEALQISEKKYRLLHESITDAVVSVDMTGKITECNKAYTKMLGYNNEELAKLSYLDITPPKWHSFESKIVEEQILKKGYSEIYEKEYIKKDGTVFPVELRTFLITDDHGVATNMWAIVRDITERKSAEKALSESEAKYRTLVETTGTGFVIVDDEGKVEDANHEYVRLTGYKTLEEIIGRKVTEWTAEYDIIRNAEEVKKCFEKGSMRNLQIDYIDTKGNITPIEINANVIQTSAGIKIHTLCRDITERRRAEEILNQSEERFRSLVLNSSDIITIHDKNGSLTYATPSIDRILGYKPEDLFGRNPLELVHPDDYEYVAAKLQEAYDNRNTGLPTEYRIKRADGAWIYFESVALNLLNNPIINGIILTSREITERKRTENALRESENRLTALLNASTQPIMLLDRNGTVLATNTAMVQRLELSIDEFIGKNAFQFLPKDLAMRRKEKIGEVIRTGSAIRFEDRRGNTFFDNSIFPVLDNLGNVSAVAIFSNDITEYKRAEMLIRDSESQLRQVIDLVPHFIFAKNRKGQFVLANKTVADAYGTTVEQLLGKTDADFNPNAVEVQHFLQDDVEVMNSGCMKDIPEEKITDSTGQVHYLHTIKIPFRPISTIEEAILGVSTNITGRKIVEDQLQASYQQMRQLTARVQEVREEESTRIAREIHDELGQILTGIKMDLAFLEDILLEQANVPQCDKLISKIESTSRLVDGAIQTVRKVTTELRPAILDSMGILAAIEWQAEEFQRRTGITCEYNSLFEDIELDRARSTTIFRILQESLTNIVRHSKATKVSITFKKENNMLFFDIIDNGTGVQMKDMKKLNSFGILGMKERASLIGGYVEIQSTPGKGTTVSVKIPLEN